MSSTVVLSGRCGRYSRVPGGKNFRLSIGVAPDRIILQSSPISLRHSGFSIEYNQIEDLVMKKSLLQLRDT